MAKTRRSYQGGAASTTTGTSIAASGATTFTIAAYTGWPYGSAPFFVVVEPGTSNEEKMLVTRAGATDTTINIYATPSVAANRGVDDTTAFLHASGSTVYPVFTATDADEANELASTLTTQGDILIHGASTFGRVGIGTAAQVLKVNSGATAPEWGQVATAGIADDAITAAKIATGAVGADEIAANAVGASELADNAVDTAAIVDLAVTTGKLADANVTYAKLNSDVTNRFPLGKVGEMSFYGPVNGGHENGTKRDEVTVTGTNRLIMIAVSADDVAQFEIRRSTGGTLLRTDDTVRLNVFSSHSVTIREQSSTTTYELWNQWTTDTSYTNVTAYIIDLGPL
jgi:hypothetical protein